MSTVRCRVFLSWLNLKMFLAIMVCLHAGPPWEYSYGNSSNVFSVDLSKPVWNDGEHHGLMGNLPLSMCRVDHAGEYGADRIYAGQLAVLANTPVGQDRTVACSSTTTHRDSFTRFWTFFPVHLWWYWLRCKQYITTCINMISLTLGVAFDDSLLISSLLKTSSFFMGSTKVQAIVSVSRPHH